MKRILSTNTKAQNWYSSNKFDLHKDTETSLTIIHKSMLSN